MNVVRRVAAGGLIVFGPPPMWLLVGFIEHSFPSWSVPNWLMPVFAFGALSITLIPGIAGIWMLRLPAVAKLGLLPFYAMVMWPTVLMVGCIVDSGCS